MKHYYIQPTINAHAKLFLKDYKGKYIKWTNNILSDEKLERYYTTFANNRLALVVCDDDVGHCRETLCNSFSDFILNLRLPVGHKVTLKPPTTKADRPLVKDTGNLTFGIHGQDDVIYQRGEGRAAVLHGVYKILSSKKKLAQVYALMDVILGTAALLIDGPGAYTRSLIDKNKLLGYDKGSKYEEYAYDAVAGKQKKVFRREADGILEYNGVSNFWMRHPATLSLILGLGRHAIELCVDGKYDEIDEDIGVEACRYWLAQLTKKKELTKEDKTELLLVMSWFKPYFNSDKVSTNLGAYPINKYTWEMFVRFTKQDFGKDSLYEAWKSQGNIYGLCNYGFYTWCKKQPNPVKSFAHRPTTDWRGESDRNVYFSVY